MRRPLVIACLCAMLAACGTPKLEPVSLPPAPPSGEPSGIAGLEAQALRAAFGPPSFVRKDGQIEIWRYDGTRCRAFFFLYPNGGSSAVRHVETLPRGAEIAADTSCLDELRARASRVS